MPPSIITISEHLTLNAPIETLWPLLSDTDRVNRLIRLPAFERTSPDTDFTQQVFSHIMGLSVSWQEFPFEWIFEQWFQVERAFPDSFPISRLTTSTRFSRRPDGRTDIDVQTNLTPRNVLG